MNIFSIVLFVTALFILVFMIKKLQFSQILLCILSGIASLFACDLIFSFYGANMPINIYTVGCSSVGGIPAVILLTLLKTFIL